MSALPPKADIDPTDRAGRPGIGPDRGVVVADRLQLPGGGGTRAPRVRAVGELHASTNSKLVETLDKVKNWKALAATRVVGGTF
jgi:hypothetical protein